MGRLAKGLFIVLVLVAASAGAQAQDEEGVFVDPDSPTGREYAIPAEKARRDAAGGTREHGSAKARSSPTATAPRFGSGISPRRERQREAVTDNDKRKRESSGQGNEPSDGPEAQGPGENAAAVAVGSRDPRAGSSTWTLAGLVAAVLLGGGLLGVLLRRVLRHPS